MAMLAAGLLADSLGVVSLLRIAGAVLVVAAGYGFWVFRGVARRGERAEGRGLGRGGRGRGLVQGGG
jgi:positive regulator of sigma E activity